MPWTMYPVKAQPSPMTTAVKYKTARLRACDKIATAAAVIITASANAQLN